MIGDALIRTGLEKLILPCMSSRYFKAINEMAAKKTIPKIAIVKQDVNEDLYCCPPFSDPRETLASTILRSGPAAMFSRFNADFFIVKTEDDPECSIWKEKWTHCKWCPIEWFESFRDKVPGRSYGNGAFAVSAADLDWGKYDIVISVDISVPARITRRFPHVVWCYYVREVKTPSYVSSKRAAVDGYDIYLNQLFHETRTRQIRKSHVVDFPYHLQYYGCFHQIFERTDLDFPRNGIFLEHHSVAGLTTDHIKQIEQFGRVFSTALTDRGSLEPYQTVTTMQDMRDRLLSSKYFVKCGGRVVFGTAMVEAIAAGCLVIGDPAKLNHNFLYTSATSAVTFNEVLRVISSLEDNPALYRKEVRRQRDLIDYTCFARPVMDLFRKTECIRTRKMLNRKHANLPGGNTLSAS